MATAYHVFGPCIPQTDTGMTNAFEEWGVTEDGGKIEEEYTDKPIKSDIGGTENPVEYQGMGVRCTITLKIVAPDEAVHTKLKKLASGGSADGTPGVPGFLRGTTGQRFSLYLPSATQNPWVFTNCKFARGGIKEGTENGVYEITIEAWRFVPGTATSIAGTTLFTRTAPS